MAISYAGIYLNTTTPKMGAAIEDKITLRDVLTTQPIVWPGKRRDHWTFPGVVSPRPVRVGSLWWPTGASRFGVAHYVCTDTKLQQISQQVYANGYAAKDLVVSKTSSTGTTLSSITASMWMLPPWPLFQITGTNGLWLLTLVDDRFWWWQRTGAITVSENTTTWAQLYASIGTALGVTITAESVESAYLKPSKDLASYYEYLPLLLDTVAHNCGQRIIRETDGNVSALSVTTSQSQVTTNLALLNSAVKKKGGGLFRFTAGGTNDLPAVLPATVRVTFPQKTSGVVQEAPYTVSVTLASLALSEFNGVTGNANTKTFHDAALYDGTNSTELTTLATQQAKDWYKYQAAKLDLNLSGIVDWTLEGLSDWIEWVHSPGAVETRIQRPPFDYLTEELLHASTVESTDEDEACECIVAKLTTASAPTTFTVSPALTAGATVVNVTVSGPSTFPGRDNFRIQIESEIIEVTAGAGTTAWTITRGVDGSAAAYHETTSTVTLVGAYGWTEQQPAQTGNDTWTDASPARTGTFTAEPARELSHSTRVPTGSYVILNKRSRDGAGTSTITSALTTSATSVPVTSRSSFPQVIPFYIRVSNERMKVTAGAGTGAGTFTVTRAQYGTSAAAHASGATVTEAICEWAFDGGAGTSTFKVEDIDSSPTVANVSTLRFDAADGFVVSGASGIARVDMLPASATQTGVVTTIEQTFAGVKHFTGTVSCEATGDSFQVWSGQIYFNAAASFVSYCTLNLQNSIGANAYAISFGAAPTVGQVTSAVGSGITLLGVGAPNAGYFSVAGGANVVLTLDSNLGAFTTANPAIVLRNSSGALVTCFTGTGGGGDAFIAGLCTSAGSGPSTDFGTW